MDTYLTIITTALVVTQIIRLLQNAYQLKHMHEINKDNGDIIRIYKKIEKYIDKLESDDGQD